MECVWHTIPELGFPPTHSVYWVRNIHWPFSELNFYTKKTSTNWQSYTTPPMAGSKPLLVPGKYQSASQGRRGGKSIHQLIRIHG